MTSTDLLGPTANALGAVVRLQMHPLDSKLGKAKRGAVNSCPSL